MDAASDTFTQSATPQKADSSIVVGNPTAALVFKIDPMNNLGEYTMKAGFKPLMD
ncbi:hypothetical protein K503DRAFT_771833, partial [Rhizopogon vinicolor AM-OR11-026]